MDFAWHLLASSVADQAVYYSNEVVHSYQRDSGYVLVDWLRPAPLSGKKLKCVCEVGDASWLKIAEGNSPIQHVHVYYSSLIISCFTECGEQ